MRANQAAAEATAQAQRAEGVKDFVLALFAGVSPDESKGRVVSAQELIARGERRLGETLATHPELRAERDRVTAHAERELRVRAADRGFIGRCERDLVAAGQNRRKTRANAKRVCRQA